jgi:hypothetical protein
VIFKPYSFIILFSFCLTILFGYGNKSFAQDNDKGSSVVWYNNKAEENYGQKNYAGAIANASLALQIAEQRSEKKGYYRALSILVKTYKSVGNTEKENYYKGLNKVFLKTDDNETGYSHVVPSRKVSNDQYNITFKERDSSFKQATQMSNRDVELETDIQEKTKPVFSIVDFVLEYKAVSLLIAATIIMGLNFLWLRRRRKKRSENI